MSRPIILVNGAFHVLERQSNRDIHYEWISVYPGQQVTPEAGDQFITNWTRVLLGGGELTEVAQLLGALGLELDRHNVVQKEGDA